MAIHVAIGSEPDQRIPALVLEHSILRHAKDPVVIHWSWDPRAREWNPLAENTRLGGTGFSAWRWIAPRVVRGWCEFNDKPVPRAAIYQDCDQVVLADLGDLVATLPAECRIACVVGAVGSFGDKDPDPGAVETSVMVFRPEDTWDYTWLAAMVREKKLLSWIRATYPDAREAKSDYAALQQATWIARAYVHVLDPGWNHMNYVDERTKIVHFTHVRSQPWKSPGHALSSWWGEHLREAVSAGAVTIGDVEDEVAAGNVDAYWLAVARGGARAL